MHLAFIAHFFQMHKVLSFICVCTDTMKHPISPKKVNMKYQILRQEKKFVSGLTHYMTSDHGNVINTPKLVPFCVECGGC